MQPRDMPGAGISYATRATDAERDLQSLDREITARLSRTFGIRLIVIWLLAMVMFLPMCLAPRTRAATGFRCGRW